MTLRIVEKGMRKKEAVTVGLNGNCADVMPELAERGVLPDILTDQTSAHDPLNGYVPQGLTLGDATQLRRRDPEDYLRRAYQSIARHVSGMLDLQKLGAVTFEFGNNIRTVAFAHGRGK